MMQTSELLQNQIPCARKIWQRRGEIRTSGLPSFSVKTLDISIADIAFISPVHLAVGRSCSLNIPTVFRGTAGQLSLQGTVAYSILSGISGFRIGVNFIGLNEPSRKLIGAIIDDSYW